MVFNSRRGRPYNPKKNPPGVGPHGLPVENQASMTAFEFSDFSEGTKQALKEILERKRVVEEKEKD